MFQIIIGGLLAIIGGIAGVWIQAKCARRIKMDEIIAEKKVIANNEAYGKIKTIEAMLFQSELGDVKSKMYEYDDWFFNTRLFLPGKFPNKWLSIKSNLIQAISLHRKLPETANALIELEGYLKRLVHEAIDEIYKEMKLSKIEIEKFQENRK